MDAVSTQPLKVFTKCREKLGKSITPLISLTRFESWLSRSYIYMNYRNLFCVLWMECILRMPWTTCSNSKPCITILEVQIYVFWKFNSVEQKWNKTRSNAVLQNYSFRLQLCRNITYFTPNELASFVHSFSMNLFIGNEPIIKVTFPH